MSKIIFRICTYCGKQYKLGYTGTIEGCDLCTGMQRDERGYYWRQGEQTAKFINNGSDKVVVEHRPHAIR